MLLISYLRFISPTSIMATFHLSKLYSYHNIILLSMLFSTIYSVNCTVSEEKEYHVVSVQSLLPNEECSSFPETDPWKLKITNRHGPCSQTKTNLTHEDILEADQTRANWLINTKPGNPLSASKIPARKGTALGSGNYVIQIAMGTPGVPQTVIFDTGSDVTWVQCQPCIGECYTQQDPLFDPSKSSTYSNISCNSQYCTSLTPHGCTDDSTCLYQVRYGDNSFTVGYYSQDTINLGTDAISNFRFGCGERNNGLFGKAAGLMGLGRKPSSIVSQTMDKYHGIFSYCLPALSSSTGYLTFGKQNLKSPNVQYTPMLSKSTGSSFYFLELQSITVGGERLNIDPKIFATGGAIIDSGTVITRMPPTAYAALKTAFRKRMTAYPAAPEESILDTCYDLSGYRTVQVPTVAFNYREATVNLDATGILYVISEKQVCLGFAPNGEDGDLMIVGNTQQRRFNVVYDVGNKLVGFGAGGC